MPMTSDMAAWIGPTVSDHWDAKQMDAILEVLDRKGYNHVEFRSFRTGVFASDPFFRVEVWNKYCRIVAKADAPTRSGALALACVILLHKEQDYAKQGFDAHGEHWIGIRHD